MHKLHRGHNLDEEKTEEWALDNMAGLRERTQSGGRFWFDRSDGNAPPSMSCNI